ncbi:hypothetical protein MMC12_005173 [Toensbergia leucococca]|nr:hypothetical protein [Toensbergia leucococca]
MNVVIAILLVWRARVAIPSYVAIAFVTLGHENAAKIGIANTDWSTLIWIVASRATMFLIDTSLARFILPWPIEFFLGSPASPIMWRWKVGFHDQEIIVRKSRKWDRELPNDWLAEESDGFVYKERIMPGIDRAYVQAKTGYLMIDDKNWDLAFAEMITAHALVSQGTATISDFQKSVIVYSNSHGWLVWSVYKLDEGHQEEGRKKLVLFKDKLTAMGKESLFFQWIELLQYETSQSNGFTKARQVDAMKKAKELFESQGVDFEEFWKDVGGVDGLPGMEVTR